MNPAFLANIEKDGVTLMDRLHEKYEQFEAAVSRLREALKITAARRCRRCGTA